MKSRQQSHSIVMLLHKTVFNECLAVPWRGWRGNPWFMDSLPLPLLTLWDFLTISKTMAYWVALAKAWLTGQRKCLFPFCEATSDTAPSFELHIAREMLTSWNKSSRRPLRCVQMAAHGIQGNFFGVGFVQTGEDERANVATILLHERHHTEDGNDIIRMWKIHCWCIFPLSTYQRCPNSVQRANLVFYTVGFAAFPAHKTQCRDRVRCPWSHRKPVAELRIEPVTPKC